MSKSKKRTEFPVQSAMIAALYIAISYAQELILPTFATGAVQIRIAEALCALIPFTPAAVAGLTVGCFVTNLLTVGVIPTDLVLGTFATLVSALLGYAVRKCKLFSLPLPTLFLPTVINGLIVGLELELFYIEGEFTFSGFLLQSGLVFAGELIACVGLGIPLYLMLKRINIFKSS